MTRQAAFGSVSTVTQNSDKTLGARSDSRYFALTVVRVPSDGTDHAPSTVRQPSNCAGDHRSTSARRFGLDRKGFTLLDTLVIATAMAFLLGVTGSVLQVLSQAERQIRNQQDLHRTIFRLSNQFREDVHAARIADVSGNDGAGGNPDRLRLTLGKGRLIEYELNDGRVERVVLETQRVMHREEFLFPESFAPRWERIDGEVQIREIVLILPRRIPGENENAGEQDLMRVLATVGFDHRFHSENSGGQAVLQ